MIAKIAPGANIPASQLQPGPLSDITVTPDDAAVQTVTKLTITYTTTNNLPDDHGVQVTLPPSLTIDGYSNQADFTIPTADSAVKAKVLNANTVLVPNRAALPGGSIGSVVLHNIRNQNSI